MSVSNRCAPGGGRPNGASFAPGNLEGTSVRSVSSDPGAVPNQFVVDALDRATALLPPGYYPQITAGGGRAGRSTGTQNHPNGDAADIQIVSPDGNILTPYDAPNLYQDFIGGLVGDSIIDNRVAGIGMYSWGIHFDQSGWRQTGSGGVQSWNGHGNPPNPGPVEVLNGGLAAGRTRSANGQYTTSTIRPDGTSGDTTESEPFEIGYGEGQVDPALAAAAAEAAQSAQATCTPPGGGGRGGGGSGGCAPVSSLAIGAASSMSQNQGLAVPSELTQAASDFAGNELIQQAAGVVEQVQSVAAAAQGLITDPLGQLGPVAADAILGAGTSATFNALTGRLPSPVASILGGQNIISSAITDVANQVFGSGNLARFSNVFNNALGAVGVAQGLAQSLSQVQSQMFGNARNIIGLIGNPFSEFPGMDIDSLAGGLVTDLIGNQSQVLGNLLGDVVQPFAAFGTVYRDFNSMVTQGIGSITGNINLLGADLSSLGNLANMGDLLRIGTPGQIIEQLAVNGASAVGDIIAPALARNRLNLTQINAPEYDDLALEILGEVQESALLQDAFDSLNIQRSTSGVTSLADLVNPDFLFPNSKNENRFNNLNEISLHLAICGAQGFQNIGQFGDLLTSMESIATEDSVSEFVSPLTMDEIVALRSAMAPTSEYSGDNDLTVADFIGTAAGYRHTETLPLMKALLDDLNSNSITANYRSLNTLLSETLNGDYTSGPNIIVPTTAGYTFGTYTTLDAAATAIKDAIETELDVIENTATGDTLVKLKRLQSYHDEISHQLYKEHKLRQQYGINITDNTESVEFFAGDGSTTVFELVGTVGTARPISVFLDGVKQSSNKISFDRTTNRVTFTTAPGSGAEIEVDYDNGKEPVTGSVSDIWNFAQQLESFATNTGFGREADFLRRVVTNDSHGTRIKGSMIQARNRQRAADAGMECPGYNRVLSDFNNESVNGITNYTELTGIWSSDPTRAAEIYLQQREDVESREEYIATRIKTYSAAHQKEFDKIMSKVLRQLIFYANGNIAVSNLAAGLYFDYSDTYREMEYDRNDAFVIDINGEYPFRGYALGTYKTIVSEILRIEGLKDSEFNVELTQQNREYLKSIGVDMNKAVGILQKTMLVNASNYLGLDSTDVRNIFGMPSVGRYLLSNIANGV